ncbi:MAG TPA: hypothetical protein VF572_00985 [Candidatus Saccharimonadales bacterium]|jgi:hypothetical protein
MIAFITGSKLKVLLTVFVAFILVWSGIGLYQRFQGHGSTLNSQAGCPEDSPTTIAGTPGKVSSMETVLCK